MRCLFIDPNRAALINQGPGNQAPRCSPHARTKMASSAQVLARRRVGELQELGSPIRVYLSIHWAPRAELGGIWLTGCWLPAVLPRPYLVGFVPFRHPGPFSLPCPQTVAVWPLDSDHFNCLVRPFRPEHPCHPPPSRLPIMRPHSTAPLAVPRHARQPQRCPSMLLHLMAAPW